MQLLICAQSMECRDSALGKGKWYLSSCMCAETMEQLSLQGQGLCLVKCYVIIMLHSKSS